MVTYPLLEFGQISWAESVRLGNNRNEVDTAAKSLHDFDIEWLECMASRTNEVQAGVDAEINLLGTARLLLLEHVGLVLIVQELDDRLP